MKLTIFHDGQFFIGLIEYTENEKSVLAKYTFGTEPDKETILNFIDKKLLNLINKSKAEIKHKSSNKKINPKRLQRQVAKEQKKKVITTQSQEALKKEQELKKKSSKKKNKQQKEAEKARKRRIKKQKAKEKHNGH
ncbi:YjdF family protein [Staphylococcus simulans]